MNQSVQQELQSVQRYLELHHGRDAQLSDLPEGSINAVLNQLSPAARAVVRQNMTVVTNFRESGGREMPFQEKRSLDDLDLPAHSRAVMQRADTEDTIYRLNDRMGTPKLAPPGSKLTEVPTMREHIEASFTEHEGAQND